MRELRHVLDPGEKFVLAQIDPFNPQAYGAKIPDSNTVPSCFSFDTENQDLALSVTTNQSCWAFNPTYTWGTVPAIEGVSGWTWQGTFGGGINRSKRGGYIAQFELDRPVAHAVRLSSSVAPLNATGFVHIAIAYESFYGTTSWPYPTTLGEMSGYQYYKRVTLASLTQSPLTIINKYVDDTAFRYKSSDSPDVKNADKLEFNVPNSWGTILIAVEGVGAANPLSVEHLLMTEAIPKNTSPVQGSNAAPFNQATLAGASNMSAQMDFSHTEAEQQTYFAQAVGAAQSGAAQAGQTLFSNVVIPAMRNFGFNAAMGAVAGIAGINRNPYRLT